MKYIFVLLLSTISFLNADMLFDNTNCIVNYKTYNKGKKYQVQYSSNPNTWIKTNKLVSNTSISTNIYKFSYDQEGNELCIISKAKQLGLTEQDYNFTMSILGALFGLTVLITILGAL